MISYNVIITDKATKDIKEIAKYISQDLFNPMAALQLVERLESSIASLSQMPTRHKLVKDEDLARKHIRKIFVDNYIVFYCVNEEEHIVEVIRVLFNKRNWNDLI